ncbi:hypothetical protein HUU59_12990 [bacterium]|nr:hypothetical protein [bacterium]
MKNTFWVLMLTGILAAQVSAQTEASMCVTVTDVCCDDNFSIGSYTVPANTDIYKTYVYHNGNEMNKVYIECWDIVNGQESFQFWTLDDICGCESRTTTENHQIGQNHQLRFKVKCKDCEGGNCALGSSTVYIYTSVTAATCPVPCEPE